VSNQTEYRKKYSWPALKYYPDICTRSRERTISIVTRPRTGGSGVRMPVKAKDFYFLQKVQIGSGAQEASYLMGTGVLPRE